MSTADQTLFSARVGEEEEEEEEEKKKKGRGSGGGGGPFADCYKTLHCVL